MKIAINRCFGGFDLSHEAVVLYAKRTDRELRWTSDHDKAKNPGPHWDNGAIDSNKLYYYCWKTGDSWEYFDENDIPRNDPNLIGVIEELGKSANGRHALLAIIEIPEGIDWEISEYDGRESVAEKHRTWG